MKQNDIENWNILVNMFNDSNLSPNDIADIVFNHLTEYGISYQTEEQHEQLEQNFLLFNSLRLVKHL
jgi:hypothetical protein